jgi:hypothetical protein
MRLARREHARFVRGALASQLIFACGSGLPAPVAGSEPATHLVVAPPVPRRSTAGPLSELATELASARGLELAQLPELVELERSELLTLALAQVRRETPERVRATAVRALSTLELASDGFDYFAAVEAHLSPNLRAFYEPERRTIFTDRALTSSERERAALHELVHASQFAERTLNDPEALSDQRAALLTLAEGEAVYVSERMRPIRRDATDTTGTEVSSFSDAAPAILGCSLAAPYVDGRALVMHLHQAGGWAAVDQLWSRPPRSTHELLHPEAPRAPVQLGLPPAPDERGWQLRSTDVLGEQALRCVLQQWWAEPEARRIAGAWIGDRLAWFAAGRESAVLWALQFDGGAAAERALAALRQGLALDGADVRRSREERASELACRTHRDSGVVGALSQAEHVWLLALHGLSTEAGCRRLAAWSSRVRSSRTAPPTRVGPNSPVSIHPWSQ